MRGRKVKITGFARDDRAVSKVQVAISKRVGRRTVWLQRNGSWKRKVAYRGARLRTRGASRSFYVFTVTLRRGAYRAQVIAKDSSNNTSRRPARVGLRIKR